MHSVSYLFEQGGCRETRVIYDIVPFDCLNIIFLNLPGRTNAAWNNGPGMTLRPSVANDMPPEPPGRTNAAWNNGPGMTLRLSVANDMPPEPHEAARMPMICPMNPQAERMQRGIMDQA